MVWPIILQAARVYAPYVVFPFALVVGFVGYNFEWLVRGSESTLAKPYSIAEERDKRMLEETEGKDPNAFSPLKDKAFVPKTIFDRKQ
jgi:hypothetical protein